MEFCGLLVFTCPIKPESHSVVKELTESNHRVTMITGDHALTACHVAQELKMNTLPSLLLSATMKGEQNSSASSSFSSSPSSSPLRSKGNSGRILYGYDPLGSFVTEVDASNVATLARSYSVCMDGDCITAIIRNQQEGVEYSSDAKKSKGSAHAYSVGVSKYLGPFVPHVTVFARTNPAQKEMVVLALNLLGNVTLMCGDGTNDVGALRQAHVGVAVLSAVNAGERSRGHGIAGIGAKGTSGYQPDAVLERMKAKKAERTNLPSTKVGGRRRTATKVGAGNKTEETGKGQGGLMATLQQLV